MLSLHKKKLMLGSILELRTKSTFVVKNFKVMKSIGLLLIVLMSTFQGLGQTIASSSVPKIVKDKFEKSYANVTDVEWHKQGKNYQASFKSNNTEWISSYDGKGNPVSTGKTVPTSALPPDGTGLLFMESTGEEDAVSTVYEWQQRRAIIWSEIRWWHLRFW